MANVAKNLIWNVSTSKWAYSDSTAISAATASATTLVATASIKIDGSRSTDTAFTLTAGTNTSALKTTLLGGAGGDTLTAVSTNKVWFNGGAGDDTITGGQGADTFELTGSFGTDTLKNVGAKNAQDTIKIGTTFSNLSFSAFSGNQLTVSAAGLGDALIQFSANTVSAMEGKAKFITSDKTFYVQAAAAATVFTAASASAAEYIRQFAATAGSSLFKSGGRGDTLIGGAGADTFNYNSAIAVINGGSGNDMVNLTTGTTTSQTLDLTNSQFTSVEIASATGMTAGQTLRGIATADTLIGGTGADAIWTRGGNDVTRGGNGADTFWFAAGDGVDTIQDLNKFGTKDTVKFASLNQADLSFAWDTTGSGSLVTTYGTSGSDIVFMTAPSGLFNVQTADKTFGLLAGSYAYATANTTRTGTTGADYIRNFYSTDVTGGSTLTINGGGGADTLIGGTGKDNVVFNSALAYVDGGAGVDTLEATASVSAVTIDLFNNSDKFLNIEYVAGGTGNDVLRGYNSASETLSGGAGNDALWSAGGNDSMDGGAGTDTYWFAAGDGNDSLTATNSSDVYKFSGVSFSGLTFAKDVDTASTLKVTYGSDTVTMQTYNTLAGMQAQTFQTSDATFHLITDQVAGNLTGTTSVDLVKMFGDTGVSIDAKGGADTIYGGSGDDTISYYADLVSVDGGAGTNKLAVSSGTYTPATVDLTLAKYTNIQQVDGGSGNDVIRGTAGAQTLTGGAGNDALWGAAGDDVMTGGAGVDTYWFTAGDGTDTITAPAAASDDTLDVVKFYSVASTTNVTAALNGSDLNITLTDGSKLVLQSWSGTNKVNKFTFDSGTYKLSDDAATWTKLS